MSDIRAETLRVFDDCSSMLALDAAHGHGENAALASFRLEELVSAPPITEWNGTSWMPRLGKSGDELSALHGGDIPQSRQNAFSSVEGTFASLFRACCDVFTSLHKRLYFQDAGLEADYLVFYVKNRTAPLCITTIFAISATIASVAFVEARGVASILCRVGAVAISISSCVGMLVLKRQWDRIIEEDIFLKTSEQAMVACPLSRGDNNGLTILRGDFAKEASAQRRTSAMLHENREQKRVNATRQEYLLLWSALAFYAGSLALYLSKGECPGSDPSVCIDGIHIDGGVVIAYVFSAGICRARFLYHAVNTILATILYLTIRATVPTTQGFPNSSIQCGLFIVCAILAALSIATIWLSDRSERWYFYAQTLVEKQQLESNDLAKYCKAVASSTVPYQVAVRLSQGKTYVHCVPQGAVCTVALLSDAHVYKDLSPLEIVQMLQRGVVVLDSCIVRLGARLTKTHCLGDVYMIVSGADDDAPRQHDVLDDVLAFLRLFTISWMRSLVEDRIVIASRSQEENVLSLSRIVPVAAIDVGEVFLTAAGLLSFVAAGKAVRNAVSLLNYSTAVGYGGVTSRRTTSENECVLRLRTTDTAADKLRLCPHRLPLPHYFWGAQRVVHAERGQQTRSIEVDVGEWCGVIATIGGDQPPTNPFQGIAWLLESASTSLPDPLQEQEQRSVISLTTFNFDPTGVSISPETDHSLTPRDSQCSPPGHAPSHRERVGSLPAGPQVDGLRSEPSLLLTPRLLVLTKFADEETEFEFGEYVKNAEVDKGRSQWEFVFITSVTVAALIILCEAGEHRAGAFSVDSAVFWMSLAVVSSLCGGITIALVSVAATGGCVLIILRMLEFLSAASFIAACFVATSASVVGSGNIIWHTVVSAAIVLRERCQGLLFLISLEIVTTSIFLMRAFRSTSPFILKGGDVIVQSMLCFGVIVTLILFDRFRREQYSDERSLQRLERRYAAHAAALQQLLEAMIPSKVVGRLMATVRHTAAVASNDGLSSAITLMGKITGLKHSRRRRTQNLWQSPFTTFSEDSPVLLVRVFPRKQRQRERHAAIDQVDVVDEACKAIVIELRRFDSLSLVKVCGATMMIADQCEKSEPTGKCLQLSQGVSAVVRKLHALNITCSAAMTVGPMVGAVVGTVAITFEYFGQAPASCRALLDAIQPGEVVATKRFVELVSLSLECPRIPLLHPSLPSESPLFVASNTKQWSTGVDVGPHVPVALRRFGVVLVHWITVTSTPSAHGGGSDGCNEAADDKRSEPAAQIMMM